MSVLKNAPATGEDGTSDLSRVKYQEAMAPAIVACSRPRRNCGGGGGETRKFMKQKAQINSVG